ncbi:hypothetical protein FGO68_gene10939 [Halteria grandinella]|uniref:Uncharacterized protein n=1 Tax=Halteria grandinella TaxID=5974 RepID=A0A8J8T9W6_HALGN|nr:hypothetical protein FGO68_gene10939 [Halteria grandinella]
MSSGGGGLDLRQQSSVSVFYEQIVQAYFFNQAWGQPTHYLITFFFETLQLIKQILFEMLQLYYILVKSIREMNSPKWPRLTS